MILIDHSPNVAFQGQLMTQNEEINNANEHNKVKNPNWRGAVY